MTTRLCKPHPARLLTGSATPTRHKGIDYPMFTLERLLDAAELMQIAAFDPYGYRGAHGQSIEMAVVYYACFSKGAGFSKTVTRENSGSCPNAAQYYGRLVNGGDRVLLIGADRFPADKPITWLEADAQESTSSGAFSTDAILFGKWREGAILISSAGRA